MENVINLTSKRSDVKMFVRIAVADTVDEFTAAGTDGFDLDHGRKELNILWDGGTVVLLPEDRHSFIPDDDRDLHD